MKKDWVLTQEALDGLLDWLDHDREQAALEYERIRGRLIRIFIGRGCYLAEELADETINRVTVRVPELANYEGEKILYFYVVARNVYREWMRDPRRFAAEVPQHLVFVPPVPNHEDDKFNCLDRCWEKLTEENRNLFEEYNREEKGAKSKHREILAKRQGIAINALRIRAHRIRIQLKHCMNECLEQIPAH